MAGQDDRRLDDIRAELVAGIAELERLSAESTSSRNAVALDQPSVGRLSRMDAIQGQEMALETERRRAMQRQRLVQAVKRIDAGEYGFCTQCGEPIPEKRLSLDPGTPTCVSCAR